MSMVKCEECEAVFDSDTDCDCFNDFEEAICESCRDNADEAAWEAHCADFHEAASFCCCRLMKRVDPRRLK